MRVLGEFLPWRMESMIKRYLFCTHVRMDYSPILPLPHLEE
jgi:hypothetical protein